MKMGYLGSDAMERIIVDCFGHGDKKLYDGRPVLRGYDRGNNMVELEDGRWLKSVGDGRYYLDTDDLSRWAEVIDLDTDLDIGDIVGYCELS